MTDFDPEKFEDKYANYFPELQRAYKNAFETMNDSSTPSRPRGRPADPQRVRAVLR